MKYIFMKTSKDIKSAQNDIMVNKKQSNTLFLIETKKSENCNSTALYKTNLVKIGQ